MLIIIGEAMINERIFKAYDIRGIFPRDLDGSTAKMVGYAFGRYIGEGERIGLCMDVRTSSPELKRNAMQGLLDSGLKIVDIGVAPTPVLHFAVSYYKLDGGMMITASHNPKEWNGFKFYKSGSVSIGLENGLSEIRDIAERPEYVKKEHRNVENLEQEVLEDYKRFLLDRLKAGKGMRVGIDPGNGAYSGIAKDIFKEAGAEVFAINDSRNGNFPNRSPEPKDESLSGLKELVSKEKLDFGIAFDADGDRGVFVNNNAEVLRGDRTLAIIAMNMIKKGDKLVFDVSCSEAVEDGLRQSGGIPVVTRIGRTFISKKMLEVGAGIGGELSGHTYFADMYYADDPMFAGLKIMEIISNRKKSLEELGRELPDYKSIVLEMPIEDSLKSKVMEIIHKELSEKYEPITIDGIKVKTDEGWFIIRVSNTTPMIKIVAEAKNSEDLEKVVRIPKEIFEEALSHVSGFRDKNL